MGVSQVAVITGAGSGIGRATAHELAQRGHRIVVADINAGAAEVVVNEITQLGGQAVAIGADVCRDADTMVAKALSAFGVIDIFL